MGGGAVFLRRAFQHPAPPVEFAQGGVRSQGTEQRDRAAPEPRFEAVEGGPHLGSVAQYESAAEDVQHGRSGKEA